MASAEMPKYKCHKEVHALKIVEVKEDLDGKGASLVVEGPFAAIGVDLSWLDKHDPVPGGYYVVYKDGYGSYSPARAFEEGYSRI